jgi:hypothetical protein
MFDAVLQQFEHPEDYTVDDLRMMVVYWMASHPELMLATSSAQIMATYTGGQEIEGVEALPGPFSLRGYLNYMLGEGAWGDQIVLRALSMMFGLSITVLNADGLYPLGFRHSRPLHRTDVVVVYNGGTHYVGTGNYSS